MNYLNKYLILLFLLLLLPHTVLAIGPTTDIDHRPIHEPIVERYQCCAKGNGEILWVPEDSCQGKNTHPLPALGCYIHGSTPPRFPHLICCADSYTLTHYELCFRPSQPRVILNAHMCDDICCSDGTRKPLGRCIEEGKTQADQSFCEPVDTEASNIPTESRFIF